MPKESIAGQTWSYQYDAIGNRTSMRRTAAWVTTPAGTPPARGTPAADGAVFQRVTTTQSNALNQMVTVNRPQSVELSGIASASAEVELRVAPQPSAQVPEPAAVIAALPPQQNRPPASGEPDGWSHWLSDSSSASFGQWPKVKVKATTQSGLVGPLVDEVEGRVWIRPDESPAYDPRGNLISDGGWTYQWDARNRLIAAEMKAEHLPADLPQIRVEHRYDWLSRRVVTITKEKRVEAATGDREAVWRVLAHRHFWHDGWHLMAETVQGVAPGSVATVTQRYIWGLDLAGDWERGMGQTRPQGSRTRTGGVGALLGVMTSAGKTYSVCNDANGNVMGFIDLDTASLTARFDYDAFGNPITNWTAPGHPASETITRVRFSSKHQDPHTGWVYYGYRWYDPENGRWPSKDPIEERGGINLYGMVGNDAVNRIDLLGLADILVEMTRTYHQWDTTSNFTAKATSKAIAACCKEVKGQTIELKKGKYSLVPDPRFRGGDIDYPIPTGNHTGNWSPSSTTSIQAIVSSINAGIIANYDNAMTAYQQAVSEGGGATPNLLQRIFGKIGQGGGPSPPGEITLYGIPVGEFGTHNILINPGRGFSGTRMHIGENCNWSRGCPIVGKNAQLRSTAITIYQGQVG